MEGSLIIVMKKQRKEEHDIQGEAKRLLLVVAASFIMALNINSFIHAGNLIPGGFNGITLLIQQIGDVFFQIKIPYTVVNLQIGRASCWERV